MYNECKFFSGSCVFVEITSCYVFVIVVDKNKVHRMGALRYFNLCFGKAYFFSQAFSHLAALGQTFSQESAFSQVAQEFMWQESATQQVSALQQVSATHSVWAWSHVVSLHFLLQHELMVRAATATITNNTFFIFFAYFKVRNQKTGCKITAFFLLFYRKLLIILWKMCDFV